MTRKRKTTTTSISRVGLLAVVFGLSLIAADRKNQEYSVVAGSVFRESGFALAGASVTLMAKDAAKFKPLHATSDARGEFAFRVSAAGVYLVRASMKGFQSVEKEAAVTAPGERNEVTLLMPGVISGESKTDAGESE